MLQFVCRLARYTTPGGRICRTPGAFDRVAALNAMRTATPAKGKSCSQNGGLALLLCALVCQVISCIRKVHSVPLVKVGRGAAAANPITDAKAAPLRGYSYAETAAARRVSHLTNAARSMFQ